MEPTSVRLTPLPVFPPDHDHDGGLDVGRRVDNLQDRIQAGVQDGQISKAEARHDEAELKHIKAEIKHDRAENGGNLTNNQREAIADQENKLSGQVHHQRHDGHDHVGQRVDKLQDRIDAGVQDGQISKSQQKHDEAALKHIAAEIKHDRAANGGNLTNNERAHIAEEEDKLSSQVHAQRHSGHDHVGKRVDNLQDRIQAGVQDGTINGAEKRHDEAALKHIAAEIKHDRAANGGNLTNNERRHIADEEDKLSGQIHQQRHDNDNNGSGSQPNVTGRVENLQDRIKAGIKDGTITGAEKRADEKILDQIADTIAADKKANGGNLTNNEAKTINAWENSLSSRVYQQRHDNDNNGGQPNVTQRVDNLQDRINAGTKDGTITRAERRGDEHLLDQIADTIAADKKANGGNLTNNEAKQINAWENSLSSRVYQQRHDNDNTPPQPTPVGGNNGDKGFNHRVAGLEKEVTAGIKDGKINQQDAVVDRVDLDEIKLERNLFKMEDGGGPLTKQQTAQVNSDLHSVADLIKQQTG